MRVSELISNKIETLLGSNYKLFPISRFNRNYTEAREFKDGENVGYYKTYNSDYGTLRKDKVIGIVSLNNAIRNNSASYYLSASYKIEFSVPRNIELKDKYDNYIQPKPFDFEQDIEDLIGSILNQKIALDETYSAKMTMSEPTYVAVETDGEFTYEILQVNGNIIVTDKAQFGSDYHVEMLINDNGYSYVELDDVNEFNEIMNNNGNAISKQNKVKVEQNVAQSTWVCTCSIDDFETDNKARKKIYNIVHENIEIVNPNGSTENLKRKQMVKITTPHGNIHLFNAIVDIDFHTTKNGNGSYDISFTDDNKELPTYTLSFNSDGGSVISSKTITSFDEIGELETPTKSGYVFKGWQINSSDINENTVYSYGENKTAIAIWEAE